MNDLFNFLKDLIQREPEVIAAFVVGVVVAVAFLSSVIYWFVSSYYSRKITDLDADLKDAKLSVAEGRAELKESQREQAELKKKARERKTKLEEQAQQNDALQAKLAEAEKAVEQFGDKERRNAELVTMYNVLVRKHNNLVRMARTLKKQVSSLNDQSKLFEKLQGQLWEIPVDPVKVTPFRPLAKNRAVIIAVMNLKGGVGKTTLTANIAASYCRHANRRVLAVDLDFQTSLTNLCLPTERVAELQIGAGRLVDNLFKDWSAGLAGRAFGNISQTHEPKLHLLANSEKLAKVEEEAKARWIMNHDGIDLRSVLRSALHDPVFQDSFDVILIDCPPRWTTGSINAIACCDYVLIPTQLDRVSSEAVPRLLGWLRDMRRAAPDLFAHFEILGVVGNRAFPRDKLVAQEQEIWAGLPAKCKVTWSVPIHHFATIIRDNSEIRRAANSRGFAALHKDLQAVFVDLLDEIEARRSAHESR